MRLLTAALPLAALLLLPIACRADTDACKAAPRYVSIQVVFVAVNTDDLDALGINFNARLLTGETYLQCAEGNIVPQSYQRLTQAACINDHVVARALVEAADNVPAVISVDTQVPASAPPNQASQQPSFLRLINGRQIQEEITLIPQIVSGTLVRLDMLSPLSANQKVPLYCIPSGQQIVINSAVLKMQPMGGWVQFEGIGGHRKVSHTTELLIFVTPTILSVGANGGTINIKP